MSESDIAATAAKCLESALSDERPFFQVKLLLLRLKSDSGCSDADLIEIQTRVIRGLMQKLGKQD